MINFKKVRYKNLLSSGNKYTEIQLDKHQTTLILGDNGAGKSTLLDALCFGLYGKGFRNLKKDLLINSVNGGALMVVVEFSIGKKNSKLYVVQNQTNSNYMSMTCWSIKMQQSEIIKNT